MTLKTDLDAGLGSGLREVAGDDGGRPERAGTARGVGPVDGADHVEVDAPGCEVSVGVGSAERSTTLGSVADG